ncbi:hypothetical protein [Marinobacter salarius]|uniref:hypothetical protein n=1 Tax=Marinobacter salarius TaxID=1420917 RepID=UPI0018F19400|nr:hypothetical protein [Marinobacter salarius]MBJ7300575.1 hypothetical protein [Marinobacter salarius]HIO29941.1 hypothetical protein [Marinobacter salarius]
MNPARKPHQIILVEHFFYPILGIVFLVFGASYGPKVAAIQTDLGAKDISEITMAVGASLLMIVALIAFPWSCMRLWKSSNAFLSGFWKGASKVYASLLAFVCVIYGLLMLVALPRLFVAAWSI